MADCDRRADFLMFLNPPEVGEQLVSKFGYPKLCCVILYLIPRTAILGAVLLTAYMFYLRDPRVRVLLPFRGPMTSGS